MPPIANYVPYVINGNTVIISGQVPAVDGKIVLDDNALYRHADLADDINVVRIIFLSPAAQLANSTCFGQFVVFRGVQVHPGHGVDPAQMVVNFLHPGNVLGTDDGGLP